MASPNSIFGEIVYFLRLKAGHTQEDLAGKSYLSDDYISKLENGQRGPSIKILSKLAEPLKKTALELHSIFLKRLQEEGLYEKWVKSKRNKP